MALFIVAKFWLCFYSIVALFLLIILHIVAFNGFAYEVVHSRKAIMYCGRRAGRCQVVVNVVHNFQMATVEKNTYTKCSVNTVIMFSKIRVVFSIRYGKF